MSTSNPDPISRTATASPQPTAEPYSAIPAEYVQFVAELVEDGRFANPGEAVAAALDLLRDGEMARRRDLALIRQELRIGLEDLRAGRTVDGRHAIADLRRKLREPL